MSRISVHELFLQRQAAQRDADMAALRADVDSAFQSQAVAPSQTAAEAPDRPPEAAACGRTDAMDSEILDHRRPGALIRRLLKDSDEALSFDEIVDRMTPHGIRRKRVRQWLRWLVGKGSVRMTKTGRYFALDFGRRPLPARLTDAAVGQGANSVSGRYVPILSRNERPAGTPDAISDSPLGPEPPAQSHCSRQ
jgi:hypothetical protein